MKLLKVDFDLEEKELGQQLVEVEEGKEYLSSLNHYIGSRMIDIVSLSEDIAVIVDDEGLLISDNPVFDLTLYDNNFQLAGTLLFASQDINAEGELELISLSNFDYNQLAKRMELNIVGVTA